MSACSTTCSCPKITLPIAALAAATWAPVASAWRTIMSSSFSSPSALPSDRSLPCTVGWLSVRSAVRLPSLQHPGRSDAVPGQPAARTRARASESAADSGCEDYAIFTGCDPASLQVCQIAPTPAGTGTALNRTGFRQLGSLRAITNAVKTAGHRCQVPGKPWRRKGRPSRGLADPAMRSGQPRRERAAERRQGSAAGAPLESAVLRRSRHAHRRRRHLVLSQDADRAAGAGEAVRLRAQAGRGQVFSGHAGREMRHRGRGRAVPGGRAQGRARAIAAAAPALPHQCRRLGRLRAPSTRCASSRSRRPAGSSPICMCGATCGRR